ncbi:hypothetical protein FEM48_Zijuj03G0003100 [Ziziphus jujuba var. spinosa]|uniref:Uncharacterized protein n=1 Tax=Ziziphus jujuba var. spinosa TaxID=714518 RepID=A0A978VM36_ZIZJJ|nr:hypothetical protein FEM48_Zijuj03G0003100 [Ziziphus jujuba var. spinosa]
MKPSFGASDSSLTALFWSGGSGGCVGDPQECSRIVLRDLATREFNAFLWLFLITITALLMRKVVKLLRLWFKGHRIPGPPCPSFFGHSKLISRENLTDYLSDVHEKYGSAVKLWLGPTQLLVSIKDPKLIREMLLKAADKLPGTGRAFHLAFGSSSLFASSFQKVFSIFILFYFMYIYFLHVIYLVLFFFFGGGHILNIIMYYTISFGNKMVQRRRETLKIELNERLLERENLISRTVVDCITERIHGSMVKGSVDCRTVSQHMAFTILGATLFGEAFSTWSKANVYEELLMRIAKDASFWASYNVTPFWKRGFWKYQCLCTKLKSLTQDIVQQGKKNYKIFHSVDSKFCNGAAFVEKEVAYGVPSCSVIGMPDEFILEELKSHLNVREEPCGNIMGIMFHGCLTTAGLINNILMRLVTNPEIQNKIYTEITMIQKGSVKQVEQNVDKMFLLLATVYESARLLPAGPLLQRCSLENDLKLESGLTIPAGAVVVVPVQLVQMDDSSWGSDASEFNPYRFLTKAGKKSHMVLNTSYSGLAEELVNPCPGESSFVLNDPNENAAFLPFGSGIRSCVGQKFVIQGVATLFASLLERYEIKLLPEAQNNQKPTKNSSVFQLLSGVEIAFVRRNC